MSEVERFLGVSHSSMVVALFITAAVLVAEFVVRQRRRARERQIDAERRYRRALANRDRGAGS